MGDAWKEVVVFSWLVPHPGASEPSQRDIPSLAPVLGRDRGCSLENIPPGLWMALLQAWQGVEEPLEATQALLPHKRALSELLAAVVLLSAHSGVFGLVRGCPCV